MKRISWWWGRGNIQLSSLPPLRYLPLSDLLIALADADRDLGFSNPTTQRLVKAVQGRLKEANKLVLGKRK